MVSKVECLELAARLILELEEKDELELKNEYGDKVQIRKIGGETGASITLNKDIREQNYIKVKNFVASPVEEDENEQREEILAGS